MSEPAQSWPAQQIEQRATATLLPYARNTRRHSPHQIAQIAASIREFGWTMPVLIDEQDGIIAGHARVMAAKQLHLSTVPVMVARGWTEAQRRAYSIADNKLTLNSDWDMGMLKLEIPELREAGFDLALTGFSPPELEALEGIAVSNPIEEWDDMPSFDQPHSHAFRSVIVHFRDEAAVDEFMRRTGTPVSPRARYVWFPPEPRVRTNNKVYAAAEE